ncbi:pk-1 [Clostera anachoreta granulovirus]|uniref:non-specific serine/threonine protein kinase n=1 Tax=Clostera anachoreta granulovirus TaxID=283675 RepID=F4ZKN0_9BBAC|nr:pk-1 [Clostera anachoreta granulovirus]AEB00291.1 pk-1 [Clostera anachoreta granulovirus]
MNPNKSISRFVQNLRNVQILDGVGLDKQSYGNVYICKKKGDPKRYVCKTLRGRNVNPLELSVSLLMKDNPHFIKTHNYVFDGGEVVMVMDYVPDGDMFDLMKRMDAKLDEDTCRRIVFALVNALHSLHEKHFIHNDVKLENLLYDCHKKRVYVCDYDLVRIIGTPSHHDGTTVYFSPEKIRRLPYEPSFDWWAVGVVTYELLSNKYPFDIDEDCEDELNSIEPQDMLSLYTKPLDVIEGVSREAMDFVVGMLKLDITDRLNTYDKIIKHPFLRM